MKFKHLIIFFVFAALASCEKEFLAAKADKRLAVPANLTDFQALLDNTGIMNEWLSYLGEISSDDYYLTSGDWLSLYYPTDKNAYIWSKDIYDGSTFNSDWGKLYAIVFYANNVLEGLEKLNKPENTKRHDEIKGSALFFRGYAFYHLSQLFCASFNRSENNSGPGIPLRLNSDINLPVVRSTIAQTYEQIINDLVTSSHLLPDRVIIQTRPNKSAAFALLSRVHLMMQNYNESLKYADSVLLIADNNLIDLNQVDVGSDFPIQEYNSEVIFQSTFNYADNLTSDLMNVDSVLYRSFGHDDLRRSAWFAYDGDRVVFKGNYNGSSPYLFSGLALDEIYLNKAECRARIGEVTQGMEVLNTLLKKRFNDDFSPIAAANRDDAIKIILRERRKELLFRGIRWSDLRRLNLEPTTEYTLYRIVEGKIHELLPHSPNYVFPIPDDVIKLSGIAQNIRN